MATPSKSESHQGLEEEVWIAISAFEQILEAMPKDRASLEALSHAYEQIGDSTRAKDYLVRLGDVLLEEHDVDAARQVAEKLEHYGDEDPKVAELLRAVKELATRAEMATGYAVGEEQSHVAADDGGHLRQGFSMADELAFAWKLMEAGEITQDEYSSVVQDLTEMSTAESSTTVSVLHVLEFRSSKKLERIMVSVSAECGTPIISLGTFDFTSVAASVLPSEFMICRGTVVFDLIGEDALVVVMNPHDNQLKKDIGAMTGRTCHFFMSLPSEFDRALARVRDIKEVAAVQEDTTQA